VVAQSSENPILVVSSFNLSPQAIAPGGSAVANVTVMSENTSPAYGATISFAPSGPLTIIGSGSTFYIGDINGNTSFGFSFTLGAVSSANTGVYPLPYTLSFQNDTDGLKEDFLTSTGQVYISVSGTPVRPLLVVSGVTFSPSTVTPGINFATGVNITNSGNEEAFGSTFTVIPGPNLTLVATTGVVPLNSLGPGQSEIVGVEMAASPTATTGTVTVRLALKYIDKYGVPYSSNSNYTVQIEATPNLKVGSFTLSSPPLRPGVVGFLGMTMINVGGDRAYDVKMVMTGPLFQGGSSTNYLGTIGGGSSASASFYFNIQNNTLPGSYTIGLTVTYTDLLGKPYLFNSNFTIPVAPYEPPSVTVTNTILDPPVLNPGATGTLSIFVTNSGTTEATNVQVNIVGGQGIVSTSYFGLGNIAPGASVTQVVGINVDSNLPPGGYVLSLDVTYSDLTGTVYHSSAPLQSNVYAGFNPFSSHNIELVLALVVVIIACIFLAKALVRVFRKI